MTQFPPLRRDSISMYLIRVLQPLSGLGRVKFKVLGTTLAHTECSESTCETPECASSPTSFILHHHPHNLTPHPHPHHKTPAECPRQGPQMLLSKAARGAPLISTVLKNKLLVGEMSNVQARWLTQLAPLPWQKRTLRIK